MAHDNRGPVLTEITAKIESEYRRRTPKSQAMAARAAQFLPGGDTRRSVFFFPYPIWVDRAAGHTVWDEDNNAYLDFHNCYTTMILGHGNAQVNAAIREQLDAGTIALGAFKRSAVDWAEILCARVPAVEQVRFTCTGNEAVMMAIRTARAFTGREKIIVEYAGYHGAYDPVVFPLDSRGLHSTLTRDTITVPYNNPAALERALSEHKGQVAAVILEGLMGAAGMVPPAKDYLRAVRRITAEHNVVFILDEVISFRLDYGGIQNIEGIRPDMTTFGKIMAGGTAMAAFGGRRELMQLFNPAGQVLHHAGTLNANPLSAAAGIAMLQQTTPDLIARLNTLGDTLRGGIRQVFHNAGIAGQITGIGSLANLHFGLVPVTDGYTARETTNREILHLYHLGLINRGILTPERGMFCISAPMGPQEVQRAIDAVADVTAELKPYIERLWPELLGTV